ncbi:MAG: hypothetical protein KJ871_05515 [Alphaproteobacteria bacterium]|nr:hypothetical protein [Alphaproteobacteria bacterium]MBU2084190.1 hypothetical protein [Alphaproteobacteria bacterium]MBU2144275.1 hypothetical protein [Alphaproteobacteria bacterium]MBU2196467.1 hypothetical protein [Alphaproteobacteria bacterium]
MKLVKVLLITLAVLLVIAGLGWQFWLKEQVAFAKVATAYGAKQVCSCLHVGERPMASCMDDFTVDISAVTVTDDGAVTTASVLGGVVKSEASYSPGLGCTLVKP